MSSLDWSSCPAASSLKPPEDAIPTAREQIAAIVDTCSSIFVTVVLSNCNQRDGSVVLSKGWFNKKNVTFIRLVSRYVGPATDKEKDCCTPEDSFAGTSAALSFPIGWLVDSVAQMARGRVLKVLGSLCPAWATQVLISTAGMEYFFERYPGWTRSSTTSFTIFLRNSTGQFP